MTRIKNVSLAGEQLVTQYGTYVFNANGIVDVPDELAQKLATINGFTIIGKVEEDTQPGGEDTQPGGEDTQPSGDVTLEGGVVWHKIEGGYVVSNDVITFTVTGSGVDSDVIPPENVTLQNGVLLFNENTDVANVHVKGVNEGETILIGNNTYKWWDVDGDLENGYELKIIEPTQTLSGGGTYTPIDGGYVVSGDTTQFTLTGDSFDFDHISVVNNQLVLQDGIDTSNLHVKGVTEGDSIQVGNSIYKWENTDNISNNGYELALISKDGWHTIEGGYVYDKDGVAYTLLGSAFSSNDVIPSNVTISNGKISLSPEIDKPHVHVIGVTPNNTIQIGDETYKWDDIDTTVDGYELVYVPEVYALPGGGSYTTLTGGGAKIFDDQKSYIIPSNFDAEHTSIQNGKLIFSSGIDTDDVHVIGVTEFDTIQIGDDIYIWVDADGNLENGYELEYVQKSIDLPNGGSYTTVKGGFALTDGTETFTLVSNNIDVDHIGVKDGTLEILPGANIDAIHVIGVTPNDTLQVGDDTYKWADTDANPENGYELKLIPNTGWKMDGQDIIYNDGTVSYTVSGPDFTFDPDANAPTGVTIEGGQLKFDPSINTLNIHVKGVEENSVIQIGDNYYKWTNADGDTSNGLELTLLDVPEGFEYDFDGKKFTVEGGIGSEITLEQLNQGVHFDENGKLIIGKDIVSSIDNIHIQGLESGSTVNVAGEDYTLMDTDNDLENGYELVGGTDDAFDWRWSNRNRAAEPQIWRHYTGNNADIKVQGVSARPTYNERAHTITLIGSEIASITNSTNANLKLAGDVTGVLSPNSMFSLKNGLVSAADGSYVHLDGVLYVPNGSITNISGNLEFTLINKKLTITSGNLDVDNAVVSGTAINSVSFANKNFLISGNKLIRNAFSKRRTIRVS